MKTLEELPLHGLLEETVLHKLFQRNKNSSKRWKSPHIIGRNVKTAPSTPDVESRGFSTSSSRHAESTGQIDMAAASAAVGSGGPGGVGGGAGTGAGAAGQPTSNPSSPTVTTTTNSASSSSSNTTTARSSKHQHHRYSDDRPNSMDSSGQKSPHKELSPKMSKSRNEKFHRLFKCVPESEHLYNTYSCAFFGDILLQGYLYISNNWFCFYSKILGHEKLIEIPVSSVMNLTREKTAFIIPNAIGIHTLDEKYVFGSLLSRDSTLKVMRRIWEDSDSPLPYDRLMEKFTDDDVSETNNNVECDDSNSGNEINSALPQSQSGVQIAQDSSCESSESDNRLICRQCGDLVDGTDHSDVPHVGGGDMLRASVRGHHYSSRTHTRHHRQSPMLSWHTISRTATKIQSMPRTNLLLFVCTGLAIFLLLSAMVLTYKVVALQARLDMVAAPASTASHWSNPTFDKYVPMRTNSVSYEHDPLDDALLNYVDVSNKDAYYLNSQYHTATVERFHNIIRANIQVLGQVHESLKHLHDNAEFPQCGPECSGRGTEKSQKDP